jgi:hypothetical protein
MTEFRVTLRVPGNRRYIVPVRACDPEQAVALAMKELLAAGRVLGAVRPHVEGVEHVSE